jgi:deoxyribodipyrimidine photo-lyase
MQVFTPFLRVWRSVGWEKPQPTGEIPLVSAPSDATIDDIEIGVSEAERIGVAQWWEGLPIGVAVNLPKASSEAARDLLDRFVAESLTTYAEDRDLPAVSGTSRLSPYLRFGCIHPRTVLEHLGSSAGADRMQAELAWREFYADVLWHRPESARRPLQAFADHLQWDTDARARERFRAWAKGETGYSLVDAGMRQLLAEGWMHNRVRMVTASFLIKDLHIDWRLGARWFMWHLVDGDLASNQHGWQWVAGTGTDAAPFHRLLNPDLQQERFDPDGTYVRRYLGDTAKVTSSIPTLWDGDNHRPEPIVDHRIERREALTRFEIARQAVVAGTSIQK